MLEIRNIAVKTRHAVYEDVSYTFQDGMLYGIVAINGSGKTTLFRAIMQLIPLQKGKILLANKPVLKRRSHIFYFESFEWLDGNLTAMDYLKFVKKAWRSKVDIEEVLKTWKMDYAHVPIRKYSLGMKQRTIIAMYIVSNAKYMIMDELTNGLDAFNRDLFFTQLKALKARGHMILMSSQYAQDIEPLCDVLLTIENKTIKEVHHDYPMDQEVVTSALA